MKLIIIHGGSFFPASYRLSPNTIARLEQAILVSKTTNNKDGKYMGRKGHVYVLVSDKSAALASEIAVAMHNFLQQWDKKHSGIFIYDGDDNKKIPKFVRSKKECSRRFLTYII